MVFKDPLLYIVIFVSVSVTLVPMFIPARLLNLVS
jgi:hypothetical protein